MSLLGCQWSRTTSGAPRNGPRECPLTLILALAVSDPLRRHLQQIAPMTAGLAIQATTDLRSLPIAPWAGLGVLAAWAAVSLLVGGMVLRLRDA